MQSNTLSTTHIGCCFETLAPVYIPSGPTGSSISNETLTGHMLVLKCPPLGAPVWPSSSTYTHTHTNTCVHHHISVYLQVLNLGRSVSREVVQQLLVKDKPVSWQFSWIIVCKLKAAITNIYVTYLCDAELFNNFIIILWCTNQQEHSLSFFLVSLFSFFLGIVGLHYFILFF